MNLLKLFKAVGAALYALFRARDSVKEPCPKGHTQHAQWPSCPACTVIGSQKGLETKTALTPLIALRILDGKDELRTLLLPSGEYSFGNHVTCDVVLTPRKGGGSQGTEKFQLAVSEDVVHLRASRGSHVFKIGDHEYKDSKLFDRDRFSLLGGEIELLQLTGADRG